MSLRTRAPLSGLALLLALLAVLFGLLPRLRRFPVPEPGRSAILATGASSGIGKHAALHLDSMGWTVYAGVRKQRDADALLAERPTLRPIIMDVADEESVRSAFAVVEADLAGQPGLSLCGLLNNAGVVQALPLEIEDIGFARQLFEVNAGVFGCTFQKPASKQILS